MRVGMRSLGWGTAKTAGQPETTTSRRCSAPRLNCDIWDICSCVSEARVREAPGWACPSHVPGLSFPTQPVRLGCHMNQSPWKPCGGGTQAGAGGGSAPGTHLKRVGGHSH